MTKPSPHRRKARALLLPLLLAFATTAGAQDDVGRAAREREAFRRAQAALRQAQEQQAALAREKSELSAQTSRLGESVKRAEAQLSGSRSEAARLRAELARTTAERDALQAKAEADQKAVQSRGEESAQRIAALTRVVDERTRTVASLTELVGNTTRSLAAAEKANREMHGFGLQLIDQLRGRSEVGAADPVLGFGQVRLENTAEALRDRLDALRLPAPAMAR